MSFVVPARFGDTGTKFLGPVGGGFRVQFGDSMAVRLEVRDLVYTAWWIADGQLAGLPATGRRGSGQSFWSCR